MVFTYIHRDSGKSHVMSLVDSNFTVKLQTSTLIANNTTGTEAMKVLRKQKRTCFVLYVFDSHSVCSFLYHIFQFPFSKKMKY
jgi:hypothetical protein